MGNLFLFAKIKMYFDTDFSIDNIGNSCFCLAYNYASEWEYSDKSQKAILNLSLDFLYNDGI